MSTSKKYASGNSPLMIIIVVVIVLAVIALAYMYGGKNGTPNLYPSPSGSAAPAAYIVPTTNPLATVTPTPKATKSPTPTPTPKPVTKTITVGSNASLDGFRASNNGGNNAVEIRAGRNGTLIERGFVSFAVPSELSGKTVDKATMRLYQGQIIGDPYGAGISVKVDHLDYGSSLEGADYSATSLSANFATLTSNGAIEYKDLDVKDMLIDDLANGRANSQYRIHLAVESTGADAFAYFESQDNSMGTGNLPQLVITYH